MKPLYEIPKGADVMLLEQPHKYLAVCVHPDRKPWFVDHDGNEVEFQDGPVESTSEREVSFIDEYSFGWPR